MHYNKRYILIGLLVNLLPGLGNCLPLLSSTRQKLRLIYHHSGFVHRMSVQDDRENAYLKSLSTRERLSLMSSSHCKVFLAAFYVLNPLRSEAADSAPPILGVDRTGLFKLCPEDPTFSGCISSQDDRPVCFIAPWEFDGPWLNTRRKLLAYLQTLPGLRIVSGIETLGPVGEIEDDEPSRYIRAVVENPSKRFVDDLEFYFTPSDSIIQYRSIRREGFDFLARENRDRLEKIRKALRLESIPVLRNRKSSLLFMESPIDTFGPPSVMFESVSSTQKNLILHAVNAELDAKYAPVFSTTEV